MTDKNRVCCLYRVSTDKQVDYSNGNEADIPMQRKACRRFAEQKGWNIVFEEQEDGVSGHKVRAENRDKIQLIKDLARKKEFDILLVFMFDRIGRIADETPFVVEWFAKNGISVWSTVEGEQRFDNHTDKLLNYIRFWQADGESEKTSIRTKTSLRQMVEEGHYKGGSPAYGYDLVKSGRFNKRKHELYDLKINESESAVVKLIFDKYTNEGYGTWRIANFLNDNGYRTRSGKPWHQASIRGILSNLTYTGVLRSGDARSPLLPELQIINPEQFKTASDIFKSRAKKHSGNPTVPLNTRGKSLLAGNVFCGHCGARLTLTTNGRYRKRKDGSIDKMPRIRYVCYGKTRKQTDCNGQTGYTMHKLDGIVEQVIKNIFAAMKGIPKSKIVSARYKKEVTDKKRRLADTEKEYNKALQKLSLLKAEVIKCLQGESTFSKDILSELITDSEENCNELAKVRENIEAELKQSEKLQAELCRSYDEIISWADLYDGASIEAKKMIVNSMIKRIDVFRDYKLKIEFNFDIKQFFLGIDKEITFDMTA
ncbi:MAG: recombinase family protein [Acutalibacteraceae bacterium]